MGAIETRTATQALWGVLVLLVVTGGVTAVSGTAAAQQGFSLDLASPDHPPVDEETQVSLDTSVPDLHGSYESQLTVTLYVDGDEVATRSLSVEDGETTTVTFSHVFDVEGETTLTAEGSITIAGQSFNERVTTTVDVQGGLSETRTVEGAAFAVPESLEDEVQQYRSNSSVDLAGNSFVLATKDALYVVFTRKEPVKGVATVDGFVLDRNISERNLTLGAVAATNVSFTQTGTEVSIQEVADNSEQYRLELVGINAHYRRVSSLTDPDAGNGFTFSTTTGVLVENPRTVESIFKDIGSQARNLSRNVSTDQLDATLRDPLRTHLHTFSFETKFWASAQARVDAIVLDPQSPARKFVTEYDQPGMAYSETGEPILYVVDETFYPRSLPDVNSIKSQSESLDGEVVTTDVRLYEERISVQETLEHTTGCDEDRLKVQTPEGPVCVNVVQDNLLHAGTAWNSPPESRDDVLSVLGVSSLHQDSPEEFKQGRYTVTGEVMSTDRIDESLPAGSVLVVYEMQRTGRIDYSAVYREAKEIIENGTKEIATLLRRQAGIETGSGDQDPSDGTHESGVSRDLYDAVAGSDGTVSRNDVLRMVQSYVTTREIGGISLSRSEVLRVVQYYINK